jgi:hypothetical protein
MRSAGSCVWGSVTTSAGRSDPVPPLVVVDVGTFYEANRDRLLGFALLLVGDPDGAEDLVHEAVAGALARPEPPDDPGAYLRTAMATAPGPDGAGTPSSGVSTRCCHVAKSCSSSRPTSRSGTSCASCPTAPGPC